MKKSPIRRTFDQASKPLKFLYRKPIRKVNVPSILGNRYLKISAYGNKRMGYDNFINDIKK
jgi:hypothetical protein